MLHGNKHLEKNENYYKNLGITKGIFVSIRHKQKFYQTHYLNGSEIQKQFYKNYEYAIMLTKIKIFSKQLYLKNEIINSRNDIKNFGAS